jgi:NADH-quinone oxidoreductase subunit M
MVQRVFYGPASSLVAGKAAPDMMLREDVALWPVAVLMLIMGVASPFWIKAIDPAATDLAKSIPGVPQPATQPTPTVSPVAVQATPQTPTAAEKP